MFTEVLSATVSDPYFIRHDYNPDGYIMTKPIVRNTSTGAVLPNCVGQAHGRWTRIFMENGYDPSTIKLSINDGSTFWQKDDGYPRGQTPRLGAVVCHGTNQDPTGNHVRIVERIWYVNGVEHVLCSNSAYSGNVYYTNEFVGGDYTTSSCPTCEGFIYLPFWISENMQYDGTVAWLAGDEQPRRIRRWTRIIK